MEANSYFLVPLQAYYSTHFHLIIWTWYWLVLFYRPMFFIFFQLHLEEFIQGKGKDKYLWMKGLLYVCDFIWTLCYTEKKFVPKRLRRKFANSYFSVPLQAHYSTHFHLIFWTWYWLVLFCRPMFFIVYQLRIAEFIQGKKRQISMDERFVVCDLLWTLCYSENICTKKTVESLRRKWSHWLTAVLPNNLYW